MLSALKESESQQSGSADGVGGDHTLNSELHSLSGAGSHQCSVVGLFEMTYIACVTVPLLLLKLLACEHCVLAVDDDYVVAAIYMGGECYLMLASEQHSCLSSNLAEGLARGVDHIPLALDLAFFSHIS